MEAAKLGCYFSINHRMLMSESGASLVKSLPVDRLLTETDAPFTEIDDRKGEPRDVATIVARLSQLRNMNLEEIKNVVNANAERVLVFAGVSIPVANL
jgi:TatD DNase family protein